MRVFAVVYFVAIMLGLPGAFCFAQAVTRTPVVSSNAGESTFQNLFRVARPGALFLLIPPDARTSAMGNTGLATNPDVTAVFYNTAKLPLTTNDAGFHAAYTPWFNAISTANNSMYLMVVGGYYRFPKLRNSLAVSGSIRHFNYGRANSIFANNFDQVYLVKPFELSADLGAGLRISKSFSMGLTTRFVHSDLIGTKQNGFRAANTILGDISLFYEKNLNYKKNDEAATTVDYYDLGFDKFFASVVIANLGGKFNYSSALIYPELPPSNIGVAVGYKRVFNEQNQIVATAEMNKLLVPIVPNDAVKLHDYYNRGVISSWMDSFKNGLIGVVSKVGVEYWYNDAIAGRAGYMHEFQGNGISAVTFGLSLKYQYASFDFSYFLPFTSRTSIYSPLANTLRFGISVYFN